MVVAEEEQEVETEAEVVVALPVVVAEFKEGAKVEEEFSEAEAAFERCSTTG